VSGPDASSQRLAYGDTLTLSGRGPTIRTAMAISVTVLLTATGATYSAQSLAAGGGETCRGVTATIVGTDQRDVITGTPGRDVVAARKGFDRIDGRGGNDLICGGRGADHLLGGPGRDRLYGEADGLLFGEDQYGDDLVGGPGHDLLDGGPGLGGRDRGLDVLRYPNARSRLRIDLGANTARLGEQRDTVYSIEEVNGTRFADVIRGDRYFQFLSGYGGADRMYGRGGPDFMFGDDGDDEVRGGIGRDILDGGTGTDVAYGGPAADRCSAFEQQHGCES